MADKLTDFNQQCWVIGSGGHPGFVDLHCILYAHLSVQFSRLADLTGKLGTMEEHANQGQPNLGPQAEGTTCTSVIFLQS